MTDSFWGRRAFLWFVCSLLAAPAFAELPVTANTKGDIKAFVRVRPGRELFVEWKRAQTGQPTLILLNGLTYSTRQWKEFAQVLEQQGFGVLRYDMFGMGETLLKYGPALRVISYKDQVKDLEALLEKLNVTGRLNLAGLSYGGGIAMAFAAKHPRQVKNLILMAPYTQPLEEQDKWIKSQIWYTRRVQPFNPYSDDALYDYFLRQIVYTTYPSAEPVVLENPFKLEAVFRMVQGIRKWTSDESVGLLPKSSVHLMIAGSDQYLERSIMENFWESVPADRQASRIVINNSEHKIPEAVPVFAAHWVKQILLKNPLITQGRQFEADPLTGLIRYDGGSLRLPSENQRQGLGRSVTGDQ